MNVLTWTQFLKLGEDIDNRIIIKKMLKQRPGVCCNILYTSGDSAEAKGAMLSHDNMTWFWEIKNRLEYEQTQMAREREGPNMSLVQNF